MRRRLTLLAALLCLLVSLPLFAADPPTPRSTVEAFQAMYESISDYQCRMYEHCRQGNRTEERTMNIYFKRPRFIRMDILEGNRFGDTGSVGVYRNDGKVRGRKGGLLSFIAITVNKNDPQATTIRGLTFDQSDLQATLGKMQFHLAESACTLVAVDGISELVFEPRDPSRNGGVTKDIIRLDAVTLLPVSSDSFEGDRLVQHAEWSSYILNAGLPDQLFDVFWDPGRLEGMGIRSVHALPVK
jgi:outer membrane lipoprotein-sorting protein